MEDNVLDTSPTERTTPQTRDQLNLKEFILLFESQPEIWDVSHEHFTNKVKRAQAYQKLLVVFKRIKPHATTDDVRKKINSLRSNYRKELRKTLVSQRSGAETDHVYKPRSWVFHMLNFLRKTDQRIRQNQLSSYDEFQDGDGHNSQASGSVYFSSLNYIPPAKREKKLFLTEQTEPFEEIDITLPSQSEKSRQGIKQNLNLTALYWTQKLEKMDSLQRIYAEKAINNILFEAEMGMLRRNSVQINVTTSVGPQTPSSFALSPSSNAVNSATSSPNYISYHQEQ
ncbi:uncharacterized protein LOC119190067 [Manduca sexta]|uniref:uncharacterized protein LOC119190067 n=1 Tax=Manduca sexta TaxID=7130 RepID=UPI00188EB8CC|nr:uncharacterized protein LOC119190067 [Manduca sexta]